MKKYNLPNPLQLLKLFQIVDKNKVVHNLNILGNYLLEFTIILKRGFVIFKNTTNTS